MMKWDYVTTWTAVSAAFGGFSLGVLFGVRRCQAFVAARERDKRARDLRIYGRYSVCTHANKIQSITCHTCGLTSFNHGDVAHLYCAKCQRFHVV